MFPPRVSVNETRMKPSKNSPILRVFGYVRRYPALALGTLGCAIGGTVAVIVFPKVAQRVVDEAVAGGHPERLLPLALLGLGTFFVQEVLNALRILLNNTFEQKVIFDLRSDLYSHIQRLPLSWFDNRATGDLMTRILEDVNAVERVLIDGIEQGIVAVLQIAVVGVMLLQYGAGMTLAAFSPLPFLLAGALAYTLTAHKRYKQAREAASVMNSLLHDNLAGIRQIKTYVREEEEHRRFNAVSDRLRAASLVIMRTWALYSPSMNFFTNAGLALVLYYGGRAVIDGKLALGGFVAVLTLVRFLYEPIRQLHSLNQLFQAGRAAGARVFEIMDTPAEPGHETAEQTAERGAALPIRGDVRYTNVSFAYDDERPVLKNISLHAPAGQTVALVGPTGAGKSSLVNLLTRFYEYEGGEIEIDGRPLLDIPKSQLRAAIGLVTQESFLFNGTVRDNLRLGNPDASDEQLLAVAEAANARGFIERLPEGLGTVVGERGVKLSVGEKQRVSIARALLKDPPILILDEATASVDTQTERAIQQALDRLMTGRTSFVIAHRLSTVRRADQILVLDHGRIIERGRHEELLASGGLYAQLCQSSFLDERETLEGPPPGARTDVADAFAWR
jgi:ATP-binding cassette subfamily B protein